MGADTVNPAGYNALRANGTDAWFGWPTVPSVEAGIAEWYDAPTAETEKAAIDKINREAVENVVYAPTGFFRSYQAWRRNVNGVVKGPLPFFWGVSKT